MKPFMVDAPPRAISLDGKESLLDRQAPATIGSRNPLYPGYDALANPTIARRRNALALFHAYAEQALANGAAPKGLEQAFAASLQISPSMWSQIKSARPIGDKLARQIEALTGKPVGWMDESRETAVLTAGEKAFLDLSLRAWRATNSAGRKNLRALMTSIASGMGTPAAPAVTHSGTEA